VLGEYDQNVPVKDSVKKSASLIKGAIRYRRAAPLTATHTDRLHVDMLAVMDITR